MYNGHIFKNTISFYLEFEDECSFVIMGINTVYNNV